MTEYRPLESNCVRGVNEWADVKRRSAGGEICEISADSLARSGGGCA
jgi:hypothetical protein